MRIRILGLLLMMGVLIWTQGVWAQSSSTELRLQVLENIISASESGSNDLKVTYNKGLKMMTADKKFKFIIGGRIMTDFAFFNPNATYTAAIGDEKSGAEIRRARIYIAGLLYNKIGFMAQYDFASTSNVPVKDCTPLPPASFCSTEEEPEFKDLYIQLVKLPVVGNFRVGHYKEPFSLENLTSSKYITFMERSLSHALSPRRGVGAGFFNHALDKRITWNVGVFFDTLSEAPPVTSDGTVNFALRVTALPLYLDKGKKLVHVGFSFGREDQGVADILRIASRPEANLTDVTSVDTGINAIEKVTRYNVEAAGVYGPFSFQFEYMLLNGDAPDGIPGVHYNGWYVHASYFITGEHRKYQTKSGTFARVSPKSNFDGEGGWGALQVALRYSTLDLNDDNSAPAYRGGEMDNITLGLNWHLNPNTRFMFNYVHSMVDSGAVPSASAGNLNIFQARFQIDF